jgi:hypothetical protein
MSTKKSSSLLHLLKPKEFRVWCRPNASPGDLSVTNQASKATCANCLSTMRWHTQGRHGRFRVGHTGRNYNEHGA